MTQETTIDVLKAYWWTQNKRGDWRAKYRRTSVVKRRAYLTYRSLINSGKLKPPTKWPVHVTAIIHPLTHGRFDPENAAPMVKAILDAITQSGYWPDDRPRLPARRAKHRKRRLPHHNPNRRRGALTWLRT